MLRKGEHMKVISICDHKGGVGKTTTAAAIAQGLASKKKNKVLLIDSDPQGTATTSCYGVTESRHSLYDIIKGTCPAEAAIIHTEAGDIIPYSKELANLDIEYSKDPSAYHRIKNGIQSLDGTYTHVVIDTAPGITLATLQALTASDGVIIPILCSPDNFESLQKTYDSIQTVTKYTNPDLKTYGVFFALHGGRSNIMKQYEELYQDTCKAYQMPLLHTTVRRSVIVQEAHALAVNLFTYAPRAAVTADYQVLIKELKL